MKQWVFIEYLFVIGYIILYYVLCALLFPDDLSDYDGYANYFYSRKKWFFGVLALLYAAYIVDTLIKGKAYSAHLHWEYPVRNVIHIILCLVAIKVNNRKFHACFVILLYQLWWILRYYGT